MAEEWSIDLRAQVATHREGLVVRIAGGEAMDIVQFPKGLSTRELPRLLQAAVQAYRAAEGGPGSTAASAAAAAAAAPAAPAARKGPRKPTLSLKRDRDKG